MVKRNIVIFYSESLSSYLLFSEFIEKYHEHIAAIVRFPVIPRRQAAQKSKRPMLVRVLTKASRSFLWFNVITIWIYGLWARIYSHTLAHSAERYGIPVAFFSTIDDACISYVKKYTPDWIFNNSPNILKKNILEVPRIGTLNYHAAKLPEYRGAGNYFWLMVEREEEAMATLHYVTEGLDSGDIIGYSDPIAITPHMSVFGLWYRLRYLAFPTYERYMQDICTGTPVAAVLQDHTIAQVRSFPDEAASRKVRQSGHSLITWSEFKKLFTIARTGKIIRNEL